MIGLAVAAAEMRARVYLAKEQAKEQAQELAEAAKVAGALDCTVGTVLQFWRQRSPGGPQLRGKLVLCCGARVKRANQCGRCPQCKKRRYRLSP
jgi:hypothetical protein